jgi:uncharacterized protein (TIGR03067 family)
VAEHAADRPALEGAWVAVAAQLGRRSLPLEQLRVRYLLLKAEHYDIVDRSNQVVDGGDYRLDAQVTPASMDIVARTGPHAGRTMQAIYELNGDELTVCYDLEGRARPHTMQPQTNQLLLRITYARTAIPLA